MTSHAVSINAPGTAFGVRVGSDVSSGVMSSDAGVIDALILMTAGANLCEQPNLARSLSACSSLPCWLKASACMK